MQQLCKDGWPSVFCHKNAKAYPRPHAYAQKNRKHPSTKPDTLNCFGAQSSNVRQTGCRYTNMLAISVLRLVHMHARLNPFPPMLTLRLLDTAHTPHVIWVRLLSRTPPPPAKKVYAPSDFLGLGTFDVSSDGSGSQTPHHHRYHQTLQEPAIWFWMARGVHHFFPFWKGISHR